MHFRSLVSLLSKETKTNNYNQKNISRLPLQGVWRDEWIGNQIYDERTFLSITQTNIYKKL